MKKLLVVLCAGVVFAGCSSEQLQDAAGHAVAGGIAVGASLDYLSKLNYTSEQCETMVNKAMDVAKIHDFRMRTTDCEIVDSHYTIYECAEAANSAAAVHDLKGWTFEVGEDEKHIVAVKD